MKNISRLKLPHFFYLFIIIIIAIILRIYNLDSKTLWIDEIITALVSLGKSYDKLPLNTLIHPQEVINIFQFQNDSSCRLVIETLTNQSTHPPLFFCLLNIWLRKWQNSDMNLLWQLRILPAVLGVIIIYLIYVLNRYLCSPKNALFATALSAVSPFGIYLAQEARHYTLAMLLILLGLILLVKNIYALEAGRFSVKTWLIWSIVMGVSFYSHYYCLLAYTAQIFSLLVYLFIHSQYFYITLKYIHSFILKINKYLISYKIFPAFTISIPQINLGKRETKIIKISKKKLTLITLSLLLPLIIFSPWFSILIVHAGSDKTSWLPSPNLISPFYQTFISWVLMIVSFPVENDRFLIQIASGIAMFLFVIYIGKIIIKNWSYTWQKYPQLLIVFNYVFFSAIILIVLSYVFDKDLTIVPRYSFFYYPAFISLISILIYPNSAKRSSEPENTPAYLRRKKNTINQLLLIFMVGLISSLCVLQNLVFKKPYEPARITQQFNQSPEATMLLLNYRDTNEMAFSLSYAYAFSQLPSVNSNRNIAIFDYSQGYDRVWQQLSQINAQPSLLWVVAPGLVFKSYPEQISLAHGLECKIDPHEYYRLGFPRQLYRCLKK